MKFVHLVSVGSLASFVGFMGYSGGAQACGGGVVTTTTVEGTVADAQRIVVSLYDTYTDVVTQIGVPETTADYGALLPVPAEPTLDPEPVPSSELDALDAATTPSIVLESSGGDSGGGGCACGSDVKSIGGGDPSDVDIEVGQPVAIGPVTAIVLSGTDGAAVASWLVDNDFVIPTEHASLIDEYSGPGRYFIAIRRNETATTGAPTSVGVHFTLPLQHGELPFQFARLGAAPTVAFTVFVAARWVAAPASPVATRNLYDLEDDLLRESYASAVAEASTRDGGLGMVIEGVYYPSAFEGRIGPIIEDILGSGERQMARYTTILPSSGLSADAHFTERYTNSAPHERYVPLTAHPGPGSAAAIFVLFLLRRPRARKLARGKRFA